MPGAKRKRVKRKVTKGRKRRKIMARKCEESVVDDTQASNASGGEDIQDTEMDESKSGSINAPDTDKGVNLDDSKTKAEAKNLSQTPNPPLQYRGKQSDSSSEEEDEKCNEGHQESARSHTSATTHASYDMPTTTTQRHMGAQQLYPKLDVGGWEKSPQLGRRPLPNNRDSVYRGRHQNIRDIFPGIELESTRVTESSATTVACTPGSQTSPPKPIWWKWLIIMGIIVAIAPVSLYLVPMRTPQPSAEQSFEQVLKKFEEKPESFLSKFPSQSSESWRKIRSTVKATTALSRPRSPGVIAIISLAASEPVANCMGRKLANQLSAAYNDSDYVNIYGKDYEGRDADDVKLEVDQCVRHGLKNGMHVVLLEGLHHLPAKSGLLFNGLCDTDNAPFKQAVYILTSVTDKIVAETDQQVTTFWKAGLPEDQRHSLETRIGNNIVVVNPEKNDSAYKECA